jgi:hypothetical protein
MSYIFLRTNAGMQALGIKKRGRQRNAGRDKMKKVANMKETRGGE